jgi:hypothetical protein
VTRGLWPVGLQQCEWNALSPESCPPPGSHLPCSVQQGFGAQWGPLEVRLGLGWGQGPARLRKTTQHSKKSPEPGWLQPRAGGSVVELGASQPRSAPMTGEA